MTILHRSDLMLLQSIIKQDIPKFRVGFKDRSTVMKVLGFLVAPFNPEFSSHYVTTWGSSVFFPTEDFFFRDPAKSFRILAHEYVHLWDAKRYLSFKFSYLFPQVLAPLPLLAYAILAWPHSWLVLLPFLVYILGCLAAKVRKVLFWVVLAIFLVGTAVLSWHLTGWLSLVLFGAVLFLAPWPAYWRTQWEVRGYTMNVALSQWMYGEFDSRHRAKIIQQFIGPSYYYMSWRSSKVADSLDMARALAVTKALLEDRPYGRVFSLLPKV